MEVGLHIWLKKRRTGTNKTGQTDGGEDLNKQSDIFSSQTVIFEHCNIQFIRKIIILLIQPLHRHHMLFLSTPFCIFYYIFHVKGWSVQARRYWISVCWIALFSVLYVLQSNSMSLFFWVSRSITGSLEAIVFCWGGEVRLFVLVAGISFRFYFFSCKMCGPVNV